jgi:hypothetical protein
VDLGRQNRQSEIRKIKINPPAPAPLPPVDLPQKSTKGAKEKQALLFCAFCAFSRQ